MSVCFLNFIPRSHIYRDMAVAAFSSGLQGWMFGSLGWSSGPAKLVGWPLQLKSGTAADFACKLFLKNKTQRQSHLTLGYFLVQYTFALHPAFNKINNNLLNILIFNINIEHVLPFLNSPVLVFVRTLKTFLNLSLWSLGNYWIPGQVYFHKMNQACNICIQSLVYQSMLYLQAGHYF